MRKKLCTTVTLNKITIGFMLERGTINAVFIFRRMQEYHAKDKRLYMFFVDLEKAFDKVPRKVLELAMRMKGIPDDLVRSVIGLCEGAKTRVRAVTGV